MITPAQAVESLLNEIAPTSSGFDDDGDPLPTKPDDKVYFSINAPFRFVDEVESIALEHGAESDGGGSDGSTRDVFFTSTFAEYNAISQAIITRFKKRVTVGSPMLIED